MSEREKILQLTDEYCELISELPSDGIYGTIKVMTSLFIFETQAGILSNLNKDPYKPLSECLSEQIRIIKHLDQYSSLFIGNYEVSELEKEAHETTKDLFEEAWGVYDQNTYDHSVQLIHGRLKANGFDEAFFEGKDCFDGGCGTGRFAIAMAQLGAESVTAVDFGGKSLEFAAQKAHEYGLNNISFVEHDVTDLSRWQDGSFDFVASQGVLHHTIEAERGILEHFRVTKSGGVFWLYLYGVGGFYWEVYDKLREQLREVGHNQAKRILGDFKVRHGAIYSFLDNCLTPIRKYFSIDQVLNLLKQAGDFEYKLLKGISDVDDVQRQLDSKYGRDILGPDGEIRLQIHRK